MKDQIDVAVRRSPKYSVFMGIGAVLGVIVAGILAVFVDPSDMPMGYTVSKGLGLMLLVLGTAGLFIGGLLALILDWVGRKRAKEYRVDAEIDMVDDPKEIARRRLAEARGEDPDAPDEGAEVAGEAVGAGDSGAADSGAGVAPADSEPAPADPGAGENAAAGEAVSADAGSADAADAEDAADDRGTGGDTGRDSAPDSAL